MLLVYNMVCVVFRLSSTRRKVGWERLAATIRSVGWSVNSHLKYHCCPRPPKKQLLTNRVALYLYTHSTRFLGNNVNQSCQALQPNKPA